MSKRKPAKKPARRLSRRPAAKNAKPTKKTPRKTRRPAQPKTAKPKAAKVRRKPAILADDIPDKVQAEYRQLLAGGLPDRKATSTLATNWKKVLTTKALRDEFWLALAGTQWRLGRLEPAVKKQALAIIDRALTARPKRRQSNDDELTAVHRRAALTSLRGILKSPQPARKEIAQSKAPSSDADAWPVGEVFAYKLLSGRYALFHVVACLGQASTGFWPVFALLDWIGADLPTAAEVQRLPLKADPHSPVEGSPWLASVLRRHPSDFSSERIDWLHIHRPPHAANIDRGFAITYWKDKLDEKLRFDFGWE